MCTTVQGLRPVRLLYKIIKHSLLLNIPVLDVLTTMQNNLKFRNEYIPYIWYI